MATILHLTDLHLSQPSAATAIGDYSKAQLLDPEEFQSRKTVLEASLESLGDYLVTQHIELDSIIITGDITVTADPGGYALLPSFLAKLGAAMVEPDRVLLTPGNHDVRWSAAPGSVERYESLLELRTQTGYQTAYFDGIDIDNAGRPRGATVNPLLEAGDGSYIAVGLNSSNHCGVDAAVEVELADRLDAIVKKAGRDKDVAALLQAWKRRGLSDLARVDQGQLIAAGNLWAEPASAATPLRIAALHHQIGPVTAVEELKAFETMSNLGAFRTWLLDHSVDVVLHGHTHVAYNRHDIQRSYHSTLTASAEHRFLVVGGGTVERGSADAILANLIKTAPTAPRLWPVSVGGLRATLTKKPLNAGDFVVEDVFVRGDLEHTVGVVAGANVNEVFEQLLGLGDLSGSARPLVCRIADGASALRLPTSYPDSPFPADIAESWLADTVGWWQRAPRGLGASFNHGERLKYRDGEEFDQIERAACALAKDTGSSRGVAVLVHPRTDLVDDAAFPSFVMLHATVTGFGSRKQLDLVAYFRKQEIPHWWPVNMAELATIQETMIDIMAANARPGVRPGSLTSVTSIPVVGEGIPFVSVPWIDRSADNPGALLSLVTPLLVGDATGAETTWEVALGDWALGDQPPADGEPIPLEGIQALIVLLDGLSEAFGPTREATLRVLVKSLKTISHENASYRAALHGKKRAEARIRWVRAVNEERTILRSAVVELVRALVP
ncbi:MAG: metallophosphoesterase [Salinibacterium sp.]|nr:metallophosphoesterase [Salinibacterium sp.]